jgi:hypothetical protein
VRDEDDEHSHGQHGSDPDKSRIGGLIHKKYQPHHATFNFDIAQGNLLDFPSHIRDKNVGFPVGRSRYPQETGSCQVWVARVDGALGKNFLTLL